MSQMWNCCKRARGEKGWFVGSLCAFYFVLQKPLKRDSAGDGG